MYIDLVELIDLDNNKELKKDLELLYDDCTGDNDKLTFEEFVVDLFKEELLNIIECRKDSGGFLDY